jgi:hypothetical protein
MKNGSWLLNNISHVIKFYKIPTMVQSRNSIVGTGTRIGYMMMIYLLTAIGQPPGGSSSVHIYTQTTHRTTQKKQYNKNLGRLRAVPHLCGCYPDICLTTEEKAWKNLSQGSRRKNVRMTNKMHIFSHQFIPIKLSSTCFEQWLFIISRSFLYMQHTVFYHPSMGFVAARNHIVLAARHPIDAR